MASLKLVRGAGRQPCMVVRTTSAPGSSACTRSSPRSLEAA